MTYLFIGSYNYDSSKAGIYVYSFDTVNGNLTSVSVAKHVLNPAYLTMSHDGKYLYACTEAQIAGGGAVAGYAFDKLSGTLAFINSQKSGGENPVYLALSENDRWLVNANYTEGSVSVYSINANGSISSPSQVISYKEGSVNKVRQDRAHVHCAVFSPGERYIFFPDLGADKIRCYAFDTTKKEPLQTPAFPFTATTPGSGPRHFTFHPNQKFCYCIEELAGYITAYRYDDGKLDTVQRIAAHTKMKGKVFSSADIHMSPDGKFLYASNRGKENNIAIFSVNEADGRLTPVGYQSTLGDHPRNFTISPSGKFLLVANQISGNVVVFKRDEVTGLLTETGVEIKVPGASCLQLKTYTN